MPKILILGAMGYLGMRITDALIQSGQHRVYGVVRSKDKAKLLSRAEVTPIICGDPVGDPAAYLGAIRDHHIDIVVDVAGAKEGSAKFLSDTKNIGQERLDSYRHAGLYSGPRLGFIYCSGTWVHGSSGKPTNDLDVIGSISATPPQKFIAWRSDIENSVLAASEVLDIAILRPAMVYGRESTLWTKFFSPILEAVRRGSTDTVQIPLRADAYPGLIHIDDVATGFKCAVERLSLMNSSSVYPVFDLVTTQESMSGIFNALRLAWEFDGYCELAGPGNDHFEHAMCTTLRGSSDRAKQLLGWKPVRLNGFINDMDIYADAFASGH